jgi:hypothetical protein
LTPPTHVDYILIKSIGEHSKYQPILNTSVLESNENTTLRQLTRATTNDTQPACPRSNSQFDLSSTYRCGRFKQPPSFLSSSLFIESFQRIDLAVTASHRPILPLEDLRPISFFLLEPYKANVFELLTPREEIIGHVAKMGLNASRVVEVLIMSECSKRCGVLFELRYKSQRGSAQIQYNYLHIYSAFDSSEARSSAP